jgi:hypothetical protein
MTGVELLVAPLSGAWVNTTNHRVARGLLSPPVGIRAEGEDLGAPLE